MSYSVSSSWHQTYAASLVGRGGNGGSAGSAGSAGNDVHVIEQTMRTVDVKGINNHQITGITIITAGGVVKSQRGPVIVIRHQRAYIGHGHSIHLPAQLEHYQTDANDRSIKVQGGLQRIKTLDGYIHPMITIISGLPYVHMYPYTDEEWDMLPHIVWTSNVDWDSSFLDHAFDDDEQCYNAITNLETKP